MVKTPHVQAIVDDLEGRFDGIRVGAWKCRRIAGRLDWSQHAYTEGEYEGNAADIFPWSMGQGDEIAAYIRTLPNVKVVLWRVKNHYDHVHFDTWPTGVGTPPCKGGKLRVEHEDGRIGRTFKEEDLPLNDDDKAWISAEIHGQLVSVLGGDRELMRKIDPAEPDHYGNRGVINSVWRTTLDPPGPAVQEKTLDALRRIRHDTETP